MQFGQTYEEFEASGTTCLQAAVIIFGSGLLFGVNWGQPVGVAAVVILFALVGAGAGTFLGTLFRNEQQATGVSLLLGLGLDALGGPRPGRLAGILHGPDRRRQRLEPGQEGGAAG
jgi:hypothetical protein